MAEFSKLSAVELKELLAKEGVDFPSDAKKKDLVALAEKHVKVAGADEEVEEEEVEEKAEVKVDKKDPETVTMEDAGFSPTGRYEVICVNKAKGFFRVFGPRGQKVSPVFTEEQVVGNDTLQPVGLASRIAAGQNMHLQRSLGNKAYEKVLKNAADQGLAR